MKPKLLSIAVALATVTGAAQVSQANATTYTYTGNDFTDIKDETPPAGSYTTSMRVSGTFTVLTPLGSNFSGLFFPTTFSFSDGRSTITNSNATSSAFSVTTNGSGQIIGWVVIVEILRDSVLGDQTDLIESFSSAVADTGEISQCVLVVGGNCFDNTDLGENAAQPGTWSSDAATATPLPAALPLFATGIGAIGLLGWRRKRKAQAAVA